MEQYILLCKNGNLSELEKLQELDKYKQTLYEIACIYGHIKIVEFFIKRGVTISSISFYNACTFGYEDIILLLKRCNVRYDKEFACKCLKENRNYHLEEKN